MDDVAAKYNFAEMTGQRGMTQLRWATFGEPSQVNSQPHLDSDGDLVGAHNGNVVNNVELRQQFMAEGLTVRSQNDGESCVHAVERYINKGYDFIDAIRLAYGDLQGDYAFVIGRINDDKLYAIKKGSGLVVGIGEGFTCLSSDLPSILPLTRDIIRMKDGEIVTLMGGPGRTALGEGWQPDRAGSGNGHRDDGCGPEGRISALHAERDPRAAAGGARTPAPAGRQSGCAGRARKDAHGAPVVFCRLRDELPRLPGGRGLLCPDRRAGGHPGAGAAVRPAIRPGGQLRGCGPVRQPERRDQGCAQRPADALKQKGMTAFGLANVIGSTLTKATACTLPLCCGYEISVPATKTFTNQVVTFLYLAYRLAGRDTNELAVIPELMEKTLEMVAPQVAAIAPVVNAWNDLYCLGYGATYAMALEGALKLKEITYAHCEGMLSTEFKHGPLSAVTDGFPILFAAGPLDVSLIVSGINEVTCRGARAIAIGEEDARLRANASDLIVLPKSTPEIASLLAVLPLQLLSYHMSVMRGFDPDFPRNLSKTLTVD